MRRPWQIWTVFALGLAVILACLGWVSIELYQARSDAALEENVRLALWRMESILAPLVAQESGREYFTFTSFYSASRAYTNMLAPIDAGEIQLPSPLLTFDSPFIRLHFHVGPDGRVTSPQVPTGNQKDLAEQPVGGGSAGGGYVSPERTERAEAVLEELRGILRPETLAAGLPLEPRQTQRALFVEALRNPNVAAQAQHEMSQAERNVNEFQFRERRHQIAANAQAVANPDWALAAGDVNTGVMTAVWHEGALLLARRVRAGGSEYVQGAWLDWSAVREWLLAEITDLLPESTLVPQRDGEGQESRGLALLPVRLEPGDLPPGAAAAGSPMASILVLSWGGVLFAAGAVAVLLRGIVSLSERRAAFVSAVTHEMRTPLTTFQMYTEMLRDGMVTDEAKRRRYLATLSAEAERLGHLVENVLGYARLEKASSEGRLETLCVADLVERVAPRLRSRAERGGMALEVDVPESVAQVNVRADPGAVEQVLFNLVDNASKYAAGAEDRRIHLEAGRDDGAVALRVRDHGPGVAADVRDRLFRPFSKSASDAAHSAPGVGLGLAFSRRLARSMGGRLRLADSTNSGATFVLALPLA